jgi:hypothetical protein
MAPTKKRKHKKRRSDEPDPKPVKKKKRKAPKPIYLKVVLEAQVLGKGLEEYCGPACRWFSGPVMGFCLLFRRAAERDHEARRKRFLRCEQCLALPVPKKKRAQ